MYSALISRSSIVALMPRLSSTGFRVWPTSVSNDEVLHVARADLDHVGVFGHQLDAPRVHHLGHNRDTVAIAGLAQDLQPLFAHALISVGAGAGLECAAAEDVGPGRDNRFRDRVHAIRRFDRARAGDHRQIAAADLHARDIDDRRLLLALLAGQLVRRQDGDDFGDAGESR